jgi:hypothetical protein
MRPSRAWHVTVAVFVLLATGCSSENKGQLEGTRWRSEAGRVEVKSFQATGGKQTVNVPEGYFQLDFQTDGTLFYIINNQLYRGKYTLNPGRAVTLQLEKPLAGSTTHTETIAVNGSRMTMTDTDGTALNFKKVQ